jgi:hypothetical protein
LIPNLILSTSLELVKIINIITVPQRRMVCHSLNICFKTIQGHTYESRGSRFCCRFFSYHVLNTYGSPVWDIGSPQFFGQASFDFMIQIIRNMWNIQVLTVVEFELSALCLLDRCCTTWTTLQALFVLVILEIESCFSQASLDYDPPILGFLPYLGWQASTTMPSFYL